MDNKDSKKYIENVLICGNHNTASHSNCFILGSNGNSTADDEITISFSSNDQIHFHSNGDIYYNENKWRTDSEFVDKLFYYLETMKLNVRGRDLNTLTYPNES